MSAPSTESSLGPAQSAQPRPGSSAPLNRTCEGCRRRKIKCILPPLDEDAAILNEKQCIRCRKLSLDCVFLPPAVKKTRRRNEARIRDLERKLDAIQGSVDSNLPVSRSPSSISTAYEASPFSTDVSQLSFGIVSRPEEGFAGQPSSSVNAPISRATIPHDLAGQLYTTFYDRLAPLYPLVLPPSPSTWEDVRVQRPVLFSAAITAAASSQDAELSEALFQDTEKLVAEKIIFGGEKSIELIQALLILSTWYHPPPNFHGLKFTQFAHMAATMVMDLRSSNDPRYRLAPGEGITPASEDSLEMSRSFVACYLLCSRYVALESYPLGPSSLKTSKVWLCR